MTTEPAGGASFAMETPEATYTRLAWYRRGGFMSALLTVAVVFWLVGGVLGRPLGLGADVGLFLGVGLGWTVVPVVAISAATGPIHFPPKPGEQTLRRWGVANQVVAWIVLAAMAAHFVSRLV